MLHGAQFLDANLQNTQFSCATSNRQLQCAELQEANFIGAQLRGAKLYGARLQNAIFGGAQLQGASLQLAHLQGAELVAASLQDADLRMAELQGATLLLAALQGSDINKAKLLGANLQQAQLQGADLSGAQLQGADLHNAVLKGANLSNAQLEGADLSEADLQGANLDEAGLQGANLVGARLQGASLRKAHIWRLRGEIQIDLADFDECDPEGMPWQSLEKPTFTSWRDDILQSVPEGKFRDNAKKRLSDLDPALEKPKDIWKASCAGQNEEHHRKVVAFLVDLACSEELDPGAIAREVIGSAAWRWAGAPWEGSLLFRSKKTLTNENERSRNSTSYLARGLLQNGRVEAETADSLRKREHDSDCPGVAGFNDTDWANVDKLIAAGSKAASRAKDVR
jgi:uncharacterized protein YjbI with pentapeptide repeats